MRDIIFRGKRLDNGKWVAGSLFVGDNGECEVCHGTPRVRITYHIDPATIGQYAGLHDKTGRMIFEGDIVHCYVNGGIYQGHSWGNQQVVFDRGAFCVVDSHGETMPLSSYAPRVEIEVVGNIHDNQELLKGG